MRFLTLAAFFASLFFLPWYVSIVLGIILIAWWEAYLSTIMGGILLDALFGAPIQMLGGFSFIYTALFLICALFSVLLRKLLME